MTQNAAKDSTTCKAVNFVFSFYEARHTIVANRLDCEVRRPDIFRALADSRNVLPSARTTILVTGSKGKGTTARLIAWNLQRAGFRTGLVLSPEELSHLDRIRINNNPISCRTFTEIVSSLKVDLLLSQRRAPQTFYHPPTAVFLLAALMWFKQRNVDFVVIEGGRGVKYDEIGQLDAHIGVITSITREHLAKLGPSFEALIRDKLSLSRRVDYIVVPRSLLTISLVTATLRPVEKKRVRIARAVAADWAVPFWYADCLGMARRALQLLPEWRASRVSIGQFASPSFQRLTTRHGTVYLDGAVGPECLDRTLLKRILKPDGCVLLGMSDDKAWATTTKLLTSIAFDAIYAVKLTSRLGHVSSIWLETARIPIVGHLDVVKGPDEDFGAVLAKLQLLHSVVYAIGVQTFLRSIRCALDISLVEPHAM